MANERISQASPYNFYYGAAQPADPFAGNLAGIVGYLIIRGKL